MSSSFRNKDQSISAPPPVEIIRPAPAVVAQVDHASSLEELAAQKPAGDALASKPAGDGERRHASLAKTSPEGFEFIRQREALRLTAYLDSVGVWTIGYGHTGKEVVRGLTITKEKAEEWLEKDIEEHNKAIWQSVKVHVSQNEFDAMSSLAFNIGKGGFSGSSVVRLLNAGDRRGASDAFLLWNKGRDKNGKLYVIPGLAIRRAMERLLFLGEK